MTAVFVRGFDFGTTEDQLRNHFQGVGTISTVTFQGKGAAIVSYDSEDAAQQAVSTLEGSTIEGNGRYVNVKIDEGGDAKGARKGGKGGASGPQVIVRGFDFGTTEDQIRSHFDPCGEIQEIRFLCKGGGSAVIKFATEDEAAKAVDMDRSTIDGNERYVNVDFDGKGGGKGGKGGKSGGGKYGGGKYGGGKGKYGGKY
mmetsp:Transcript_4400/g.6743  ORF Transcript_4400/g.6743 Transcript_4400/m.6743 type:complete len:199 (-) Transcript_4400:107-703(-)